MLVKRNCRRSRTQDPEWAQPKLRNIKSEQKYRDSNSDLKDDVVLTYVILLQLVRPVTILKVLPEEVAMTQHSKMFYKLSFDINAFPHSISEHVGMLTQMIMSLENLFHFVTGLRTEILITFMRKMKYMPTLPKFWNLDLL